MADELDRTLKELKAVQEKTGEKSQRTQEEIAAELRTAALLADTTEKTMSGFAKSMVKRWDYTTAIMALRYGTQLYQWWRNRKSVELAEQQAVINHKALVRIANATERALPALKVAETTESIWSEINFGFNKLKEITVKMAKGAQERTTNTYEYLRSGLKREKRQTKEAKKLIDLTKYGVVKQEKIGNELSDASKNSTEKAREETRERKKWYDNLLGVFKKKDGDAKPDVKKWAAATSLRIQSSRILIAADRGAVTITRSTRSGISRRLV